MGGYIGSRAVNLSTTAADVSGNATIGGNLTVSGTTVTIDSANAQTVDLGDNDKIRLGDGDDLQIYHDASNSHISNATGNLTLDVAGNIILDADSAEIIFKDGGTSFGRVFNSSGNFYINAPTADTDIIIQGNDGGSNVNALSFDMSNAGAATFNSSVTLANTLSISSASTSGFLQASSNILQFGTSSDDPVAFFANNAERMRIDASGNVGFSTASPEKRVHIFDSTQTNQSIRFGNPSATPYGEINYNSTGSEHLYITSKGTTSGYGNIVFQVGGTPSEAMRIDALGRVGIGVVPAAVADSTGVASLQAGATFLTHFDPDGSGTTALTNNVYWNGSAAKALFYGYTSDYYQTSGIHHFRRSGITSAGSSTTLSEIVRFDGDGIKFNGDTAAANALNDYETGTWTPAISYGNIVINYASYVKVGQLVIAYCYIRADGVPSNGTTFLISGLPFTANNNSSYYPLGSLGYTGNFNTNNWTDPHVAYNNSYLYFHRNDGNSATITNADVTGANRELIVQVYYHTTI